MEFPDAANSGGSFPESLISDGALWATEEDYRAWNAENPLNSSHDSRSSSEQPSSKRSRNNSSSHSQNGDDSIPNSNNNRAKAIGKMFFKTKLCCKFRAGVCPYISNCNFAHGIEEQRRPPPNWQEIVASREDVISMEAPREERQIPTFSCSESRGESYKGRHCKKFYTEEGCPYGDSCTFLHDEQSRDRESVAISLSPSVGGGGFGNTSSSGNVGGAQSLMMKPSNWKTRICNKWETTGSCPFGNKCHFAHGLQEVHKYGGGLMDEGKDMAGSSSVDWKPIETTTAAAMAPHSEMYHQRPSSSFRAAAAAAPQRTLHKWKGPDKISKIYGDWIDDIE